MRSQLVIIHRPFGEGSSQPFLPAPGGAVWTTCLRSIGIGSAPVFASQLGSRDEVFHGLEAYQFLLETVCGLHSPVLGETEVHGQYKKFLDAVKGVVSREQFQVLHQVHVDAKRVRTHCLAQLGSQSYGSYCRRQVKGMKTVNLIGSGHLVRELLPWLVKSEAKLSVFCRSAVQKAAEIQSRFQTVEVEEILSPNQTLAGAVIVAAPIKAYDLMTWLEGSDAGIKLIIDLRAESAEDPIAADNVINLRNVFEAIESARAKIHSEVEKARVLIKDITYAKAVAKPKNIGAPKRSRAAASLPSRTSA